MSQLLFNKREIPAGSILVSLDCVAWTVSLWVMARHSAVMAKHEIIPRIWADHYLSLTSFSSLYCLETIQIIITFLTAPLINSDIAENREESHLKDNKMLLPSLRLKRVCNRAVNAALSRRSLISQRGDGIYTFEPDLVPFSDVTDTDSTSHYERPTPVIFISGECVTANM